MLPNIVIAIDGPAGAGKSVVSKRIARELGLRYLDTGAMYRCLALAAHRAGHGPKDGEAAGALAQEIEIAFSDGEPQGVLLNGEDVSEAIRTAAVGELASALSAFTPVRRALVKLQRAIVERGGVVLEGRDAATVIAPRAHVKVFMTADLKTRAKRRLAEFQTKDPGVTLEEVEHQIAIRDERDSTREDSPLKVAEGAVVLDTSDLTIEQVIGAIRELAQRWQDK